MAFLNPWSIVNKTAAIKDLIVSNHLDILAISESWLRAKDDSKPERIYHHELLPKSHHMIHMSRPTGRGGGIAIIHNKSIKVKVHAYTGQTFKQFEYFVCTLDISRTSILLIVVYRPKPTDKNKLSVKKFWREFEKFVYKFTSTATDEIIITGDLNFHLDKCNSLDARRLNAIFEEFGLSQKIHEPTHFAGHILDVLVLKEESTILKKLDIYDPGLCNDDGKVIKDHYLICWTTSLRKPSAELKTIKFRAINKIDHAKFESDLQTSQLCSLSQDNSLTAAELYDLYVKTLQDLLDIHAPLQTKIIRNRPNSGWFNENIAKLKQEKRRAERKARKTNLTVHWDIFRQKSAEINKILLMRKKTHYSQQIINCKRNQKKIFEVSNSWMGTKFGNILPSNDNKKQLAQDFQYFFNNKVKDIHSFLSDNLASDNPFIDIMSIFDTSPSCNLETFVAVTPAEVREMVTKSNNKCCDLDPAPTSLIKSMIHLLETPIASIINKSFTSGSVPIGMKSATVRPSIKKTSLDPEENKNYRPVSNLPYLSKIMEKAVGTRLDRHLEDNLLLDEFQSAYRKGHSTETLLLKLQDDILHGLDHGKATLLVMIDISAAFDVVEHQRLLDRHEKYFGITDKALQWMESYLKDRQHTVAVGEERSDTLPSKHGFPQGSVLGGKKYIMYSTPLGNVASAHDVSQKSFADDGNMYLTFILNSDEEVLNAINQLELALNDVQLWMSANMLKMNDDKTEVILFASKTQMSRLSTPFVLKVGSYNIETKADVENLGVKMDTTMSMEKQINNITSTCYYHLRKISKVRKYLTVDATRSLVNAYVVSRMDYGNSLLVELPAYLIKKIQRVQNYAARIINRTTWEDSISKQLKELHWLPIKERIQYKVILFVFKALNNLAPTYLKRLLIHRNPVRTLRSSQQRLLYIKRFRTRYGKRAFSYIGPKLWNQLPLEMRTVDSLPNFKTLLKTYLFRKAYYQHT